MENILYTYEFERLYFERDYNVKVQPFYLTIVLYSTQIKGGYVLLRSFLQALKIISLPITAIFDIIGIIIVLLSKVLYKVTIWIFDGIKQILIYFAKMIIKSVIGKAFAVLAIAAALHIIYTIIRYGTWIRALDLYSDLLQELFLYFS